LAIEKYSVSLNVDFDKLIYEGTVRLKPSGNEPDLELDCMGLEILWVGTRGEALEYFYDKENAKLQIKSVPLGADSVTVKYSGKVGEGQLTGFYKSSTPRGYMLTTHFEPNGARRFLPCVDRPSEKAVFELDVTIPASLDAVSNTPATRVETLEGGKKRVVFSPTPKMATYLLYLGVGSFEEAERRVNGVRVAVVTEPGESQKGSYALDEASWYLSSFSDYFGIPYPLPKLHLIPLRDFAVGGMENWGAITFKESVLLSDEASSASTRKLISLVTAHEVAHQWFGDLVTMSWWNDLWLNESFATFVSAKMVSRKHPEWNVWGDFLRNDTGGAMNGDALRSTHPIDVEVDTPERATQMFDEISYGKGSSVLRMIEAYIGEEGFRKGITDYLKKHSYGNARGEDLWAALGEASQVPVTSIMEHWVKTPGYPVVHVRKIGGSITFEQERFTLIQESKPNGESPWPIPLTYDLNGRIERLLLRGKDARVTAPSGLILVNPGRTGFYRVKYDRTLYAALLAGFKKLDRFDKWGLMNDAYAFLEAGVVNYTFYSKLARKCVNESDPSLAAAVAGQLMSLHVLYPNGRRVRRLLSRLCRVQIRRIGLKKRDGESDEDSVLRERIATYFALLDTRFASRLARKFRDYDKLQPDLRQAAAIAYVRKNGERAAAELKGRLNPKLSDSDRIRFVTAIASVKNGELVKETLRECIAGPLTPTDLFSAMQGALPNPGAKEHVWQWFKECLGDLIKLFAGTGAVSILLENIIPYVGVANPKEVREFFQDRAIPEGEQGVKKGLEWLEVELRVLERLKRKG
jgi:tricorn protease interacting factor F2/3